MKFMTSARKYKIIKDFVIMVSFINHACQVRRQGFGAVENLRLYRFLLSDIKEWFAERLLFNLERLIPMILTDGQHQNRPHTNGNNKELAKLSK